MNPEMMSDFRETAFSRQKRASTHRNPHRLPWHTKSAQIQFIQILTWRRASGYKIPSLTKKL